MKKICLVVACILCFPSAILAENRTVTLKEAIQLALLNNNLVKAAEFERTAAKYGLASSHSRYFPRIFLTENYILSNSPTRVFMTKLDQGRFSQTDFLISNLNNPSSAANFGTAFTLEQPLFDMSIAYGADSAKAEADGKSLALERRREDIGLQAFFSCVELQKARAALEVAGKAVRDAQEHVRLAKVRSEAGMGLRSDELRAMTFLAETEQEEITAKNNLQLAGMRLSLATGGQAGEPMDLREPVSVMPLEVSNGELLALALKNRKDLRELENEVKKAEVGVKSAGSSFLPTLYGSATYQMNDRNTPFGRDNDAWIIGADLRWELFEGMRRFNERGRTVALRNSAREYLAQHTREITLQVHESLLRRDEACRRLEVAKASFLHAEESLRLIAKRFANSLATMVEVLDAQTALNRSRASIVENEADCALATAKVWYAAGIFLKEAMK